jgi:hypothetical protein
MHRGRPSVRHVTATVLARERTICVRAHRRFTAVHMGLPGSTIGARTSRGAPKRCCQARVVSEGVDFRAGDTPILSPQNAWSHV